MKNMSNRHYDVIVVGGGASGMMAAGRAAERGLRVLLLEKNKVLGRKLAATGGGRCNILNAEPDVRQLLSRYGDAAKFLFSPFAQFGMQQTWDFFVAQELPLKVEANGRAFPECESAPAVVETLRTYCTRNQVEIRLKKAVDGLIVKNGAVVGVQVGSEIFSAPKVILATGGASHPELGASGAGVEWLSVYGHTVHQATPSIVPLKVLEPWVKYISGVTLQGVQVLFQNKKGQHKVSGSVLFTHFGLSGPVILNSSPKVKELLQFGQVTASVDLFPKADIGTVRTRVREVFDAHKNKQVKNILGEIIMPRLVAALAAQVPVEVLEKRVHDVTKQEREQLADALKGIKLTVIGTMGLEWAVLADGGVDLQEVDTKTMESKKVAGLYLTGDALHVNRPSGGYSLQLCWTTGWVAGSAV